MESIHNFRDVGGCRTEEGLLVKRGVLYRSGSLAEASAADVERLTRLGIRTICDLRTYREKSNHPDRTPRHSGVRSIHIPIKVDHHNESGSISRLLWLLFGNARRLDYGKLVRKSYREYVTDFRSEFSAVLRLAAESHNLPLLIHCTAGKDRTGFACSLIQRALGVSPEHVLDEYMRSNENLDAFTEEVLNRFRFVRLFGVTREKVLPLFEARSEYLEAAFDQISRDYGTLGSYLRDGLNFSDEDRRQLKQLLLEEG